MSIRDLTAYLEEIAPPSYQESYDNSGLLVGDPEAAISGVLVCLDSIEAVLEEAIEKNCNLIIAHHPIVFRGLKRFNGAGYVERVVMKAIKQDIAIYAIHTNLDNVYYNGVNAEIGSRLDLHDTRILSPASNTVQLESLVYSAQLGSLQAALAANQFIADLHFLPIAGTEALVRVRLRCESGRIAAIKQVLHHHGPADTGVFQQLLPQASPRAGAGLVGMLREALSEKDFLTLLKEKMQVSCVRHTQLLDKPIQKVALCGGAGSFLLNQAIQAGADIFITADFKYHEFFDADRKIVIADIGHYESEQFTIDLIYNMITNKFSNFAVYKTAVRTNPVHYF